MDEAMRLRVVFFKTRSDKEPVREWLKSLPMESKKTIGQDVKTVQFGWPLGMPLVRKLETNLWEVRSALPKQIARIIFTVDDGLMVLLLGFVKKSQKTPPTDIKLARERLAQLRGNK
ncbi:MAG: type II toxin-antitoxin system RelE/ParE family toxin [Anaerolineae bacterium]|nr:type II toxin-antitoxin system RelE/ParE family toxin [Anaerolineae bacterium]